jgi:hypothetical protein
MCERELTKEEEDLIDEIVEGAFRHIEIAPLTNEQHRSLHFGVPYRKRDGL